MVNIISIIGGIVAFLAVSWLADKFIFQKEFDVKQTLFNAFTVAIILGIASILQRKTTGGTSPIKQVTDTIASRG